MLLLHDHIPAGALAGQLTFLFFQTNLPNLALELASCRFVWRTDWQGSNGWTNALAKGYLRTCDRWTFSTLATNWPCGGTMAARVSSCWKGCDGLVRARAAKGRWTSWATCTSARKWPCRRQHLNWCVSPPLAPTPSNPSGRTGTPADFFRSITSARWRRR